MPTQQALLFCPMHRLSMREMTINIVSEPVRAKTETFLRYSPSLMRCCSSNHLTSQRADHVEPKSHCSSCLDGITRLGDGSSAVLTGCSTLTCSPQSPMVQTSHLKRDHYPDRHGERSVCPMHGDTRDDQLRFEVPMMTRAFAGHVWQLTLNDN
jgi:hypothetical protein